MLQEPGVQHYVYGTPRRTRLDHPYSCFGKNRTIGTQTTNTQEVDAPVTQTASVEPPSESSQFSGSELSEEETGNISAEYLPSTASESLSESDHEVVPPDFTEMRTFVVFEDCLKDLMKFCKECGSPVVESKQFFLGSMVGYIMTCQKHHTHTWRSQPLQNKQPLGNVLMSAVILLSGNTYAKIHSFAEKLNLLLISDNVYNQIQRTYLLPVIQEEWQKEKDRALAKVKSQAGDSIVVSGDGHCDSPGHNAKYGSYALMHGYAGQKSGTRQIVSLNLVQVSEVCK